MQNEDVTESKLEKTKRVRRRWREQQGGTTLLTIRYGNKVIKLEEGKNSISFTQKQNQNQHLKILKGL